jgi:predicted RNA-binding protein YlxR (DUF448 family)
MKNNKIPERKCVACQAHREKRDLIRVVKNAEGTVFIDDTGKANGRGAYLCKNGECVELAQKKRRLEGALKTKVPSELFAELERIISDKGDA